MKFNKKDASIVWDAKENKPLAEFDKDGVFETSEKAVIKKLKDLGYKPIVEVVKDENSLRVDSSLSNAEVSN